MKEMEKRKCGQLAETSSTMPLLKSNSAWQEAPSRSFNFVLKGGRGGKKRGDGGTETAGVGNWTVGITPLIHVSDG